MDILHLPGSQISPNGVATPISPADDELDIDAVRLSPEAFETVGVRKALTVVPVRRPSRQLWIRVHPDPAWRLDVAALVQKEDDREVYLVAPAVYDVLADELVPLRLHTVMNRQGSLTLWPIRLPGPDGRLDDWSRSAHRAAERAMTTWVRVASNRSLGAYEVMEALVDIPEPVWPPDITFAKVMAIAFKDRYITTEGHPILQQLQGRA